MPYLESIVLHTAIHVALCVAKDTGVAPTILCDCMPAIQSHEKGSSRDPQIDRLVCISWKEIIHAKQHIDIEHVQTQYNYADIPSRKILKENTVLDDIPNYSPPFITPILTPIQLENWTSLASTQIALLSSRTERNSRR